MKRHKMDKLCYWKWHQFCWKKKQPKKKILSNNRDSIRVRFVVLASKNDYTVLAHLCTRILEYLFSRTLANIISNAI